MIRRLKSFLRPGLAATLLGAAASAAAAPRLPFYFESDGAVFRAQGPQAECVLDANGAALTLRDRSRTPAATVRLQFAGAATPVFHGEAPQSGRINHLTGNQPGAWRVNQAAYSRVCAEQLYPGISAVFYGNDRRLEYDLTVAPGARPETIALRFDGASALALDQSGNLLVTLGDRQIIQPAPVIYQTVDGVRHPVAGGYQLRDNRTVAFAVPAYDPTRPLVLDPILSYATYFGGNYDDYATAVAVDPAGNIYLAGRTVSTAFTNLIPAGAFQTNFAGGSADGDGFIAKLAPGGTNLVYFTYLGGSGEDGIQCLTVDAAGHAYMGGFTGSQNFPSTNTFPPLTNRLSGVAIPGTGVYPFDGFVAELETNGARLLFSGYVGGSQYDFVQSIALDTNRGNLLYLAGVTYSSNFPVSSNAVSTVFRGTNNPYFSANAFVSVIGTNYTNAFPTAPQAFYSTYLGGTNFDSASGIALDTAGNAYVCGVTASTNFPVTNALPGYTSLNGLATNVVNPAYQATYDAFIAKFQPGCTGLVYATFLGGTNSDCANGIVIATNGTAYVIGWTASTNFPSTSPIAANQLTNNVLTAYVTNAFVVGITNDSLGRPGLARSLVFGGSAEDQAAGITLDTRGNLYIVGSTSSTNFPATDPLGTVLATNSSASIYYYDAFVTAIKSDWSGLMYSSYYGGWLSDFGTAIAVDSAGNAYITGQTLSTFANGSGLPVWNAIQNQLYGHSDAFLAKISPGSAAPKLNLVKSTNSWTFSWSPVGLETPALFTLQTNNSLFSTNWAAYTLGTWTTNVAPNGTITYQETITDLTQFTNKVKFFRLY